MATDGQISIEIERNVGQVEAGRKYKGYIAYWGTKLDFTVEFAKGIQAMSDTKLTNIAEARDFCRIELSRGGEAIPLEDGEYANFMFLIASIAWDYAQHPQTVAMNESTMLQIAKQFGAVIDGSMTVTQSFETAPDSPLLRQKFGAIRPD